MRILIPILGALIGAPALLLGYREGPLPNMTGGFGDQTCRLCHFDHPLNAPGGTLTLQVPPLYEPGHVYQVTVTLARTGTERGGFEIGARFVSGDRQGRQAGAWTLPAGGRLQIVKSQIDPSLIFVQHTTSGSATATPGSMTWTVEWKAPNDTAPVAFDVAANASNDDASPIGDYIYTTRSISRPLKR